MATTTSNTTPEQLLILLEDTAIMLQKTEVNLNKCPQQRLTVGYIEARTKIVQDYWCTIKSAHEQLARSVPKAERNKIPYFANEQYFAIEELCICLLAKLKDMLIAKSGSPPAKSNNNNKSDSNYEQGQEIHVKLPRIQLPTFSGIYDEWPTYQDLFLSLIDNNETLTKVQKLHYLKSSLSGEALSLLKHVQVTITLEACTTKELLSILY